MPGEVIGLKHGAEWTKVTERAVRCDGLDQAVRGVSASAMVVSVGARWERLADMMRAVDQPTRGKADECLEKFGLGLRRRTEKGYFW